MGTDVMLIVGISGSKPGFNIDLCIGLASDPLQGKGTIYDVLARLAALQQGSSGPQRATPTTRLPTPQPPLPLKSEPSAA